MKKFRLFYLFCYCLLISSCFHEPTETNSDTETFDYSQAEVAYYLDGSVIEKISNNSIFKYKAAVKGMSEDGQHFVKYLLFSTKENYIEWGEANDYNIKGVLEFEQEIHSYLERHPEIEQIENYDDLPLDYLKFEEEMYLKHIKETVSSTRGLAFLYKQCSGGSTWSLVNTLPLMPGGWNNTVSAAYQVNVTGLFLIYDRSFYRSLLVAEPAFIGTVCWQTAPWNDRMTSVVHI